MIKRINLADFRNFKRKSWEFNEKTTVIVGPNASGKTNILESLFLLSTGKSFHARIEEEMINYNAEIARVSAEIHDSKLEVALTRGENGWPRKKLLVNDVSKRLIDFAGNFKIVLFGPWDLDLVTASPSLRRNFLDTVLSQVDREYRRAILSYEKGLRQRNKLLFRIRDEFLPRSQLLFWNQLLIKNGDYLSAKREELIRFANSQPEFDGQEFQLEYDKSAISEARLEQYAEEEVAAATTLVGPHRDDFVFKIGKRDLARFGSRGEQRMAVLWLKMAELAFLSEAHRAEGDLEQHHPTLLLDDIFSELDHEHRKIVNDIIKKGGQVIITTADEHFLKGFGKIEKIRL
jgi:DNA replication and repair protein RecF